VAKGADVSKLLKAPFVVSIEQKGGANTAKTSAKTSAQTSAKTTAKTTAKATTKTTAAQPTSAKTATKTSSSTVVLVRVVLTYYHVLYW
jgi:hypothetical protein